MANAPAFKASFIQILRDLQQNGKEHGESLTAVGALAAAIAAQLKAGTWTEAKSRMSDAVHTRVLKNLEADGVAHLKAGNHNAAYAAQVIAVSMIARRYRADPEMQTGENLLDKLIDYETAVYHHFAKVN